MDHLTPASPSHPPGCQLLPRVQAQLGPGGPLARASTLPADGAIGPGRTPGRGWAGSREAILSGTGSPQPHSPPEPRRAVRSECVWEGPLTSHCSGLVLGLWTPLPPGGRRERAPSAATSAPLHRWVVPLPRFLPAAPGDRITGCCYCPQEKGPDSGLAAQPMPCY